MEWPEPNYGTPNRVNGNEALDVEPLRTLAPMFPPAFGHQTFAQSLPKPVNSAFPSLNPQPISQTPPQNSYSNGTWRPTPSFQTPLSSAFPREESQTPASGGKSKKKVHQSGDQMGSDGNTSNSMVKPQKKKPKKVHTDAALIPSLLDPKDSVDVVLMTYDALRRRLTQMDDGNDVKKSAPSLKAGTTLLSNDLRANMGKRIGSVPGVEVGDIFYYRMELCLVGLHAQSMAGIDTMTTNFNDGEDTVAISVVSAGVYDDHVSDTDTLIYTGHGNTNANQKLERGNLALERSLQRKNLIRVIRSLKDYNVINGKIYYYDGLYKTERSWVEKNESGFDVFKYKLLRMPGQPQGHATWKMTKQWKDNPLTRGRVILPDVSSGVENVPVCLVNEVDDEKGPSHFKYVTKVEYMRPLSSMKQLEICQCLTVCLPGDNSCTCAKLNGENLPYSSTGILVSRKPMIYECNASCCCSTNCRNRFTQKGVRLQFEAFKTRDRGWGLRSWDPIRAGTFICEYAGKVISKVNLDDEHAQEDEYIFQTIGIDEKTLKWNYGPELLGEPSSNHLSETSGPLPIVISAKYMGNISRFMNHSCSPNVFWQPVLHDHGDEGYPHIMFFAIKHIPPMTELTYDYGLSDGLGPSRPKKCLCGSPKCRGFFG